MVVIRFIVSLLFSALAVFISSYIVPGASVDSFLEALVVAIVLGLLNALIRPILTILTLPINIITLGLFSWVITAGLVLLTNALVGGFQVDGFTTALLFGFVLALVNWFLDWLV